jgi:hypothetical protein
MDKPLPHSQGWTDAFSREIQTLIWNLICGLRVLSFRRYAIKQIVATYDQLLLLLAVYGFTLCISSYVATKNPEFTVYGFGYLGSDLLVSLFIGYLIAKASKEQQQLLRFLIISYAIASVSYLLSEILLPLLPQTLYFIASMMLSLWFLALMFFVTYELVGKKKTAAIAIFSLWVGLTLSLSAIDSNFWYEAYDELEEGIEETINSEKVFYSQYDLLDQSLTPIKAGIEGINDLFFVGFGSYATQDVFMKEISHIQKTVDSNWGTYGRSVALINNIKTVNDLPLASSTNLGIVLQHFGQLMNPDEDVLMLYLTSHGSKTHELSVDMWPLGLNNLTPKDIKEHLDNAGIRWRIILVSACYSGGFIEPLKDEYSLILTAAAHDKTSFGCSNTHEFTYFGEALFKEQPKQPIEFIPHFEQARLSIKQREASEGLEASDPQLYIGREMREKIAQLEREIEHYPAERF